MLSEDEERFLLKLAREVVEKFARNEKIEKPMLNEIAKQFPSGVYSEILNEKRGVFCTLHKIVGGKKMLRGCIGMPYPVMPLIDAIVDSAKSACCDPRFPRLSESELKDIKIEISILTEPEFVEANGALLEKINPHKDGLILKYGFNAGLFLPQVWEQIPDKEEFLDNLCLKASLPPGTWKKPDAKIFRFHVQAFEEK